MVKQVTLNVTDMDKINIVSCSQAVLEMPSFSIYTRSMSSSPLVSSLVKNRLFNTALDINELPFQFINTIDLSVVDTMLHDSPDLVIHRTEIGLLGGHRLAQGSLAFLDTAVQLLPVHDAVCKFTVLLEQSRYQTLRVSLVAV